VTSNHTEQTIENYCKYYIGPISQFIFFDLTLTLTCIVVQKILY